VVNAQSTCKRKAFTLIELIFAILIISIAVMAIPRLNQVTQQGMEGNIVQEAIFAASAELMGTTSGYWDEHSMNDMSLSQLSRVIDISNDCNNTTKLRPGHIAQPYHRRCLDNVSTDANNTKGGIIVDTNDMGHPTQAIFLNPTPSAEGYKNDYNSSVSVTQNGDIKLITITITNSDGEIITRLSTQSANVGEIDYYSKRMQ